MVTNSDRITGDKKMKADFHVHTHFSKDSKASPKEQIEAAISLGMKTICMTDHHDLDYSEPDFEIDFDSYFQTLQELKTYYRDQIELLIGMEYGMQPHLGETCTELTKQYPFDFVIGSIHMVDGQDPYYRTIFEGKTDEEVYRRGFEFTMESIRRTPDFDSLGHIDYIVRYGKNQAQDYSYAKCGDCLDEILKFLIQNGKALELNTGGWKYGLSFPHPHPDVLRRYKELGGEMITVGSDAHAPEHIAYDFRKVKDYLETCGFKYYTEFRQRTPYFCAL